MATCQTYDDYFQKIFHVFCIILLNNQDEGKISDFRILLLVSKRFRRLTIPGFVIPMLWNDFAEDFNAKLRIERQNPSPETPKEWYSERQDEIWDKFDAEVRSVHPQWFRGWEIAKNRRTKKLHQAWEEYKHLAKIHKNYETGTKRHRKQSEIHLKIKDEICDSC